MSVNVSGHHIEITSALHDYVNEKFQKIEAHVDDLINMQVSLHVDKNTRIAKANVHVKGELIHAEAENEDMYAAIDNLVHKVHRLALKHKDKQQGHSSK